MDKQKGSPHSKEGLHKARDHEHLPETQSLQKITANLNTNKCKIKNHSIGRNGLLVAGIFINPHHWM